MQQLTMLVTAEGKWVLPESDEFHAALGDPEPDYDAVGFAVRNLGFVKFQVLDRLVTEIELCPRNVELRALLAVETLLCEAGTNLFRIRYLADEWQSEISASAKHTLARLRELCAPVYEPTQTERFRVQERDFASIFRGEEHSLRAMAQKWRVSFGNFDPNVLNVAMQNQLLSRMMIIGVKPRDKEPEWRFIGDEQRWLDSSYRFSGVGQKVGEMPDKEYGGWVREFYKAVADSDQPRFDTVTAEIQYNADTGKPRRLVRYDRLLLPWKTPSDELFVTSCVKLSDANSSSAPATSASKSLRSK
ncbi:MAG TPA: hypothetical protein VME45_08570 [Stellaceae bacterium]|nr:hypothetical protein [Stellaceae bacterium]